MSPDQQDHVVVSGTQVSACSGRDCEPQHGDDDELPDSLAHETNGT
jgi:hypothetical protein